MFRWALPQVHIGDGNGKYKIWMTDHHDFKGGRESPRIHLAVEYQTTLIVIGVNYIIFGVDLNFIG